MNQLPSRSQTPRLLLLFFAAILLPLSARAQAQLVVTPLTVNVQANAGTNAPSQTVQITNAGKGSLRWTIAPPAVSWLAVSPLKGGNNGTLVLAFQTSALPVGSHTTSFRVDSAGGSATVSVNVTITGSTASPLTVTCPNNINVDSPNGSSVVVTYNVSTSGGTAPRTWSGAPPSGSQFPVGETTVVVTAQSADGQTATCSFTVTVNDTTAPPPDGHWVFCAMEYQFCAFTGTYQVRYGANGSYFYRTLTDGTPCTNEVFGDPAFGATKQCHILTPAPPPGTGVGPTSTITCPTNAVNISPGTSIVFTVSQHPAGTVYCLRAGIHLIRESIIPKSGDTFVGQYGAILDGAEWRTSNDIDAAFRAYNLNIDAVTIRNLIFRNLRRAIHASGVESSNWTIEFNEIGPNYSGVIFPSASLLRNNYIHDNPWGGYGGSGVHNSLLESNEISHNGWEQKIALSNNVTFRNNFVHHNAGAGIWYDSDNTAAVIDGNRVEDNGWVGIFYEISTGGTITNNIIRRNGDAAVFLGTSKNTEIYNNTLENNFRAITYFLNCSAVGGGAIGWDLTNNTARDNKIVIGTQSGALANVFNFTTGECTAAFVEPYKNGQRNLKFLNNSYDVPSTTGQYWFWGGLPLYSWSGWQALGHDLTGTAQ